MEDQKQTQKPPISPPLPGAGFVPGVSKEREAAPPITHSEPELQLTDELKKIGLETPPPVIPEQHQTTGMQVSEPKPILYSQKTINVVKVPKEEANAVDATHAKPWIAMLLERVKAKFPLFTNI